MIRPLAEYAAPESEAMNSGSGSNWTCVGEIRILVIDAERTTGAAIRDALTPSGFQVDIAPKQRDVEACIESKNYHVVILDYEFQPGDFQQLASRLRRDQPDADWIILAAQPSVDSAVACLRAHAFDYLAKPVNLAELRQAVTRCLEAQGLLRMSAEALRESLGDVIRQHRKKRGLTLAQIAERTDLSVGYLSQIELGKNSASIESLYRISLGLGIKMSELFRSVSMGSGPTQ